MCLTLEITRLRAGDGCHNYPFLCWRVTVEKTGGSSRVGGQRVAIKWYFCYGRDKAHLPAFQLVCFPIPPLPNRTCEFPRILALGKMVFRFAYSHLNHIRLITGLSLEHRLGSLHFTVYACIRHRLPPFIKVGYRAGLPDAPISLDPLCREVGFPYRY